MKLLFIRASIIGVCYTVSITFGLAAAVKYQVQTPQTLAHTVSQIQNAVSTGVQPEISLGEVRRHPFSPLFLLLSAVSGGIGTVLVFGWVWGIRIPLESEPSNDFSLPDYRPKQALPESQPINLNLEKPSPQPQQIHQSQKPQKLNIKDPRSLPFDERRKWLYQLLVKEVPWFIQLFEATPVLFYGQQRAGKSQPALALLVARRLFLNHEWEVVSPHGSLENWKEIGKVVPVYGGESDYRAINRRINAYYERTRKNDNPPYSVLWDELTRYKDNCNSEELLLSFLSESQKTNQFPIMVSHGITSNLLGGTKGTCDAIRDGVVQVYIVGERGPTGKIRPTGRATVIGLTKSIKGEPLSFPVSIPSWLQGQQFLDWFPELQESIAVELRRDEVALDNDVLALNRLWNQDPIIPPHESFSSPNEEYQDQEDEEEIELPELTPELKSIISYAKKQARSISVRDVCRAGLKDLGEVKADVVRSYFQELVELGFGEFHNPYFTLKPNVG